jgi:uncharacterized membrane protein YheB (UPF0754 family)
MSPWLISIPFISALIHWVTIWMALKMLFHPRQPKRILGIRLHGVFPKKQKQIAENLGRIVGRELLSYEDIATKITDPNNLESMYPMVEAHIEKFLTEKLTVSMPMIAMFIGEKTIAQFKGIFMEELKLLLPELLKSYVGKLQNQLDLERIVYEKVAAFSSNKLEEMLNKILTKEFRFVELIGAILGFLIGLMQIGLTFLVSH